MIVYENQMWEEIPFEKIRDGDKIAINDFRKHPDPTEKGSLFRDWLWWYKKVPKTVVRSWDFNTFFLNSSDIPFRKNSNYKYYRRVGYVRNWE